MSDNTNNGFPVPEEPLTREEQYLSAIAGVTPSSDIPEKPLTRVEAYLNKIVENGGGGGGGFTPTDAQLDAMNSGITSEDVEQISTNKNNILTLEIEQKNKLDITKNTGITKGANLTYTINNDGSVTIVANNTSAVESLYFDGLPYISGNLVLSGCPIGGGENSYLMDIYQDNVLVDNTRDTGSGSGTFTLSNTTFRLRVRFAKQTEPLTITIYPMIVLSDVWAAGSTSYQPYAMTNAEITAWIKSHS